MEVLVIGGSRFSGRETVKLLAEKGHDVTVLNRGQSDKKIEAPFLKSEKFNYPTKVKTICADRTDFNELKEKLDGYDFEAVIDTCAFNEKDIQGIIDLNFRNLKHYVFISTASVYDDINIKFMPVEEDAPIGSAQDDFPIPYTRDKRRAELLLKKEYEDNQFPFTLIRPTYIYGPFNYIYRETYFFDRILDGKPIYMPGSGNFIIDWVYAKDLAWLTTIPLENKKAIGEAYNAAGDGGTSLNNFVKIVSEIIGKEAEIIHYDIQVAIDAELKPENRNQYFPFQYAFHFTLSKYKAKYELGYNPVSLPDGLKETFEWYKKHKNPEWKGDYGFDEKLAKLLKNH